MFVYIGVSIVFDGEGKSFIILRPQQKDSSIARYFFGVISISIYLKFSQVQSVFLTLKLNDYKRFREQ
jgi:hypothetical protein